jgi:hypothetical protein
MIQIDRAICSRTFLIYIYIYICHIGRFTDAYLYIYICLHLYLYYTGRQGKIFEDTFAEGIDPIRMTLGEQ